jgi:hypothetical protein
MAFAGLWESGAIEDEIVEFCTIIRIQLGKSKSTAHDGNVTMREPDMAAICGDTNAPRV